MCNIKLKAANIHYRQRLMDMNSELVVTTEKAGRDRD